MAKLTTTRGFVFWVLLCPWVLLPWACDSKNSTNGPGASQVLAPGAGYCMDSCTKDCASDNDCAMASGELCCDLGSAGKTCMQAEDCPRLCTSDDECAIASGKRCMLVDLNTNMRVCTQPNRGLQACSSHAGCNQNEVCCENYSTAVCLPPSRCPKACATSSECDTASSEICCTSAKLIEPSLNSAGLCMDPRYQTCPKTCSHPSDCNSGAGEFCCDGFCSTSCLEQCKQSSDCDGQICCKSALMRLPVGTRIFSAGPHCTGSPFSCDSSICARVLGCTSSTAGSCQPGDAATCSLMTSESSCNALPGCSFIDAGNCVQSMSYSCLSAGTNKDFCASLPGCSFEDSGSDGVCSGAPQACNRFKTSTDCATSVNCNWSSNVACTGTSTLCADISDETACELNTNCFWNSSGPCTGTPTPCSQLSNATCLEQPGCMLTMDDG